MAAAVRVSCVPLSPSSSNSSSSSSSSSLLRGFVSGPVRCSFGLQVRDPARKKNNGLLLLLPKSGLSHFSGSSVSFLRAQLNRKLSPVLRIQRRKNHNAGSIVRAAFIFEFFMKILRFFIGTPIKLFAQKLEDDLDKASKLVVSGAKLVKKVAEEVDEMAEKVEDMAEKTAAMADKVDDMTEELHDRIDNVLDVIEGEKEVTINGSTFTLVEKKMDAPKDSSADVKVDQS